MKIEYKKGITRLYQPVGQDNYFYNEYLRGLYPHAKALDVNQIEPIPEEFVENLFSREVFDIYFSKETASQFHKRIAFGTGHGLTNQ